MRTMIGLFLIGILACGCGSKEKTSQEENDNSTGQPDMKQAASDSSLEGKKQKLLKIGMTHLNKAEIPEAVKTFNEAIKLDPNDTRPYFILAETYMHLQNYEGALAVLDNVIKLEPQNGHAYYLKGIVSGLSGKKPEAVEAAQKSIMIFKEKQDEENFKRSLALLQELTAEISADKEKSLETKISAGSDAVSQIPGKLKMPDDLESMGKK